MKYSLYEISFANHSFYHSLFISYCQQSIYHLRDRRQRRKEKQLVNLTEQVQLE
jgi:hypothetical protein